MIVFWHDWSNVISAKDGSGIVEMPKTITTPDIRFKVEYAFEGEANIDMELRDVMQKLPQVPYKSSYQNVSVRSSTAAAINAGPSTTLPAVVESVPAAQSSASVMSSTINTSTISNSVGNLQTLSNVSAQEAVMKQIIHGTEFQHRGVELSLSYYLFNMGKHLFFYGGGGYQFSELHYGKNFGDFGSGNSEAGKIKTSTPIAKAGVQCTAGSFMIFGEYVQSLFSADQAKCRQLYFGVGFNL